MQVTRDINVTLNKEQLCKLVLECYGVVKDVAAPYSRIEGLAAVADLEKRSCGVIGQEAYFDDLHDYYFSEVAFVRGKVLDIESPKALVQIGRALRAARWRDSKLLSQACFVYKMITGFDTQPQPKLLFEASELLSALSFFNQPKPDLYKALLSQTERLIAAQPGTGHHV